MKLIATKKTRKGDHFALVRNLGGQFQVFINGEPSILLNTWSEVKARKYLSACGTKRKVRI